VPLTDVGEWCWAPSFKYLSEQEIDSW